MLEVQGEQLSLWRHKAIESAIAARISPKEVDWLLQELTGLSSLSLRLGIKEQTIAMKQPLPVLSQLWQRRLKERVPVQHLVGETPWRHFSLKVSPDVLIPRPETEFLIDLVHDAVKASPAPHIASRHWVDLGTGSGAIALGLAEVLPKATIHAVDCTQAALDLAQENAIRLGFEQIQFYLGSWWSPVQFLQGQVGGMVSNPPYIPSSLITQLQPEVALHEPHLALDGGKDGLSCIRHLVETAPEYLQAGGIWLIEMMAGQGEKVAQLLHQQGSYYQIQIIPDLAGRDRYALAYRL